MVYNPFELCLCGHAAKDHYVMDLAGYALKPCLCGCRAFVRPPKPYAILPDLKPSTLPVYLL